MNCGEIIGIIFPKYHPDNYRGLPTYDVYNTIYILIGRMKEDLPKMNE